MWICIDIWISVSEYIQKSQHLWIWSRTGKYQIFEYHHVNLGISWNILEYIWISEYLNIWTNEYENMNTWIWISEYNLNIIWTATSHRKKILDQEKDREKTQNDDFTPRHKYLSQCTIKHLVPIPLVLRMRNSSVFDFSYQSLGDAFITEFARALTDLPCVEEINVADNRLTDEGLHVLLVAIAAKPSLQLLNISENKVGPKSALALRHYLQSTLCTIQRLILIRRWEEEEDSRGSCSFLNILLNIIFEYHFWISFLNIIFEYHFWISFEKIEKVWIYFWKSLNIIISCGWEYYVAYLNIANFECRIFEYVSIKLYIIQYFE